MTVHDVNERCDLDLPEDVIDTIGGFVFGELGRVAKVGDEVSIEGGRFRVASIEGRRIRRVSFRAESRPRSEATAGLEG